MKPSDLRRDAYTWSGIANSAKDRANSMFDAGHSDIGANFNAAAGELNVAAERMAKLADELEARE